MSKDDVLRAMYSNETLARILPNEQPTFGLEPNGCVMVEWDKFSFSVDSGRVTVWFPKELEREFQIPLEMPDLLRTAIRAFDLH